ncbi:MAG TPA: hypothetical protein VIG47_15665, partial [Gemmatimonadaceae bacterium]
LATMCAAALLTTPAIARAQYAQPTGIRRVVVPSRAQQALLTGGANAARDTADQTAKGSNMGAWGAATGAVLGGIYGYMWFGGLCKGDNGCSGRPGAVGGAVIGGILGYLLGHVLEP